jgi:hypothetical protein
VWHFLEAQNGTYRFGGERFVPLCGRLYSTGVKLARRPQALGKNLYPTLSVFGNVEFFGRLTPLRDSATQIVDVDVQLVDRIVGCER